MKNILIFHLLIVLKSQQLFKFVVKSHIFGFRTINWNGLELQTHRIRSETVNINGNAIFVK